MTLLADTQFLVLDTETTGIDPTKDRVVEVAYVLTDLTGPLAAGAFLVDPGMPIPAEASAVHHLVDEDVAGEPSLAEALGLMKEQLRGRKVGAFAAHNAAFDSAFLPTIKGRPWLCTYRMARRMFPDLTSYGNQFLRYHFKLAVPEAQGLAAHRALVDAFVTAATLRHFLGLIVGNDAWPQHLESLVDLMAQPILLKTCGFGKHKGQPWGNVPSSYLKWMVGPGGMTDLDIDTKHTANHYLKGGRA